MRRSNFVWFMALWASFGPLATSASAHERPAEARFLANEAVLVSHGDIKVLFDAFYSSSFGTLLLVPEPTLDALMAGEPPYDGIDALFVSHIHGDHFTAAPTLAYLRAQPAVRLFGPQSVVDGLAAAAGDPEDPALARITAFDMGPGDMPQAAELGDIGVDVVAMPHAGGERFKNVRNLIFRVTLGDWPTVMHMGDAGPLEGHFAPLQPHWDAKHIDTAFPPHWFLRSEEGKQILAERIKADQVIGIHVPAEARGQGPVWRERLGADVFTDPNETRRIGPKP